jgi:hypothetical protein
MGCFLVIITNISANSMYYRYIFKSSSSLLEKVFLSVLVFFEKNVQFEEVSINFTTGSSTFLSQYM